MAIIVFKRTAYSSDSASCTIIQSLFEQLDERVTEHCSYNPQLRMAAISQLLQADPATFFKDLDPFYPTLSLSSTLQLSLDTNSDASIESCTPAQETPPNPSKIDPFILAGPSDSDIFAAAKREMALCTQLLLDTNMCTSPHFWMSSNVENRPSPVAQTFSINIDEFLSPKPSAEDVSSLDQQEPLASTTGPSSPSKAQSQSLLQIHDHSNIDPASVPSELLAPYISKNHAGFSLRRPLSSLSTTSSPNTGNTSSANETHSPSKLSRAEMQDLFGVSPSSGVDAHEDHRNTNKTQGNDVPPPSTPTRKRKVSTASHVADISEQLSTPTGKELKTKRRRRSSAMGDDTVAGSGTRNNAPSTPQYDRNHPRRSKRQKSHNAQKQGADIAQEFENKENRIVH
ncbi:hypothetical protein GYMLUDRAFT_828238 [Collybiopsis luxurians FD-317 M1]|uniref:Uncharacterized protein n=1 Tax=Collybiopsis luxurians FD-317 M1 TaxID=944289 RepID=A0A0D0AZN0_9AGAR|nr:hypothetical protein GYMLUDRAFT_828238 [Collybiopsis luxurians FD-317 M1]